MPCTRCWYIHEEDHCPKCCNSAQYTVNGFPCPCGCGYQIGHCATVKALALEDAFLGGPPLTPDQAVAFRLKVAPLIAEFDKLKEEK